MEHRILVFTFLLQINFTAQTDGCSNLTEYKCSNEKCIPISQVNNSVNDCGDNSDEVAFPCRNPMFSCRNNRCILQDWVLDGTNDCVDGSDEAKLIGTNCSTAVKCCFCEEYVEHSECRQSVCQCRAGFVRNLLGTRCLPDPVTDVPPTPQYGDDCSMDSDCESIPHSSCFESRCSCRTGYKAITVSQPRTRQGTSVRKKRTTSQFSSKENQLNYIYEEVNQNTKTTTTTTTGTGTETAGTFDVDQQGSLYESLSLSRQNTSNTGRLSVSGRTLKMTGNNKSNAKTYSGKLQDGFIDLVSNYYNTINNIMLQEVTSGSITVDNSSNKNKPNHTHRYIRSDSSGGGLLVAHGEGHSTLCVPPIVGDKCADDIDCGGLRGSVCSHGVCACERGHIGSRNGRRCRPRRVGDVCDEDWECSNGASVNSECGTDGRCQCVKGYDTEYRTGGCKSGVTVNELLVAWLSIIIGLLIVCSCSIIFYLTRLVLRRRLPVEGTKLNGSL